MSDFDTRRIGEIAVLEERLEAAQRQAAEYKAIADKWQPRFTASVSEGVAKISMLFGGKALAATYTIESIADVDATTATTAALGTLFEALMLDQLRPLAQPEVEKVIQAAKSLEKVNRW